MFCRARGADHAWLWDAGIGPTASPNRRARGYVRFLRRCYRTRFSITAAKMAVADFGGKVLGRPIEILDADHQNKADVGSGIARRWFDVDKVGLVTGLGNSAVAIAVCELAKERGKSMWSQAAACPISPENSVLRQGFIGSMMVMPQRRPHLERLWLREERAGFS